MIKGDTEGSRANSHNIFEFFRHYGEKSCMQFKGNGF